MNSAWQLFSIADTESLDAIKALYDREFLDAKRDAKHLADLVSVLELKALQHCKIPFHKRVSEMYGILLEKTDNYARSHLTGDRLADYLRLTDNPGLTAG